MRVIAGRFGGRTLVAPAGMATRPTTDRVREALFSSLGSIAGAHVLDLYAGTGALAIEALSRGAADAVLVESARSAVAAIHKNLRALHLENEARVLAEPVARAALRFATNQAPRFDLVFVDPPYDAVDDAIAMLLAFVPSFAEGARIVLEHATRRPPPPSAEVSLERSRADGDTTSAYLRAASHHSDATYTEQSPAEQ